jgi:hypothetical protein
MPNHTTASQEATMASCPTHPDHRCLDCAPPTRGRPFSVSELHTGNPLDPPPPATPAAPFLAHWQGITVTRSNLTFDGVAPNHDHFVVIPTPTQTAQRQAKATSSKKSSNAQARRALLASIPVILSR